MHELNSKSDANMDSLRTLSVKSFFDMMKKYMAWRKFILNIKN